MVLGHQAAHDFFTDCDPGMAPAPPGPPISARELTGLGRGREMLAQTGIFIWGGHGLALII